MADAADDVEEEEEMMDATPARQRRRRSPSPPPTGGSLFSPSATTPSSPSTQSPGEYTRLQNARRAAEAAYELDLGGGGSDDAPHARAALQSIENEEEDAPALLYLGARSPCEHCGALLWDREKSKKSICCGGGADAGFSAVFSRPPPDILRDLFTSETNPLPQGATEFRQKIRRYNNALAFASSGIKLPPPHVVPRNGINMVTAHGAVHHLIGAPWGEDGATACFAQVYTFDAEEQARLRAEANNGRDAADRLHPALLRTVQDVVLAHNPLAQQFQQLSEIPAAELPELEIVIKETGTIDKRRYNAPRSTEIAAIMPGPEDGSAGTLRDIVVLAKAPNATYRQRISDLHPLYLALRYPLLHPYGELTWAPKRFLRAGAAAAAAAPGVGGGGEEGDEEDGEGGGGGAEEGGDEGGSGGCGKGSTARAFYAYHTHDREGSNCLYNSGRRLFQEFCVDGYCCTENHRLTFAVTHQKELRADLYHGALDALNAGETSTSMLGRRTVLPATFNGGPRYMAQAYQDAMAVVRHHGKPDLFLTMTCNPNWKEIRDCLRPGEQPNDRPDIIARVFEMKRAQLLDDIAKHQIFGRAVAEVNVVEFQKRGLPHCHMLVILAPEDKPLTPEEVDAIVCAEIPDPETNPRLYEIVGRCMMHGPCGASHPNCACMEGEGAEKHCSKNFPKEF